MATYFKGQTFTLQGARRLYVLFLRPFLQTHKPQVDACINFVSSIMVSFQPS